MFLKNLNSLEIKFIKQIILTFLKGTFFFSMERGGGGGTDFKILYCLND